MDRSPELQRMLNGGASQPETPTGMATALCDKLGLIPGCSALVVVELNGKLTVSNSGGGLMSALGLARAADVVIGAKIQGR